VPGLYAEKRKRREYCTTVTPPIRSPEEKLSPNFMDVDNALHFHQKRGSAQVHDTLLAMGSRVRLGFPPSTKVICRLLGTLVHPQEAAN